MVFEFIKMELLCSVDTRQLLREDSYLQNTKEADKIQLTFDNKHEMAT